MLVRLLRLGRVARFVPGAVVVIAACLYSTAVFALFTSVLAAVVAEYLRRRFPRSKDPGRHATQPPCRRGEPAGLAPGPPTLRWRAPAAPAAAPGAGPPGRRVRARGRPKAETTRATSAGGKSHGEMRPPRLAANSAPSDEASGHTI